MGVSEAVIEQMVDAVEKESPFANALGASGRGEGIIWKANALCGDPMLCFKSKGHRYAIRNSAKIERRATGMENTERVANFTNTILTEARLEQG